MTGEKEAPAEMPGEEEIGEIIRHAMASIHSGPIRNPRITSHEAARAILALFAPILAEKESLRRELHSLAVALHRKHYWHVKQWQPFDDALGLATQIDNMTAGLVPEARALAAEAALSKAVVFDLGNCRTIESRGDGTWAVKNGGCVLNVDGVWEYEPNPSNRTDEFIARTRFDRDDAFRRAAAIRAQGAG